MTRVIITGMHRSGTSMLSGALGLSGLYIGDNFKGPRPDNLKGHFEDQEFMGINRRMMKKSGCGKGSFDMPNLLRAHITHDAIDEVDIRRFLDQWPKDRAVGWKDPRACLTLKIWKRFIPDLKVIYIFRPVEEIAASLNVRNGYTFEKSIRISYHYLTQAMKALDGIDWVHTEYHKFFRSPIKELKRLCGFIGIAFSGREGKILDFIDGNLWHQRQGRR